MYIPSRRSVLTLLGAGVLLPLAACRSGRLVPVQGGGVSSDTRAIVGFIRTENGLPALRPDRRLERAALQQAHFMARVGRMTHDTGRGRDFASRMTASSIGGVAAENIAVGRMGYERLFSMWMNSPPHRKNMLNPQFTRYGLAYAEATPGSDQKYWAIILAS
ncbi:CAP domain-containing protein [Limoniibacter endophyticus]|uniref:SCP domain-containing protein n=1 Tax=Limoniibacter endophyticus TaxID=1565040 RepID=A0A8J3DJ95_9HYPH|nr:CAP domain-containing protein [Limoniibacter endophyticus]GHC77635.1 hypothetical protein GCM10010136_28990 [Limoniibacter endophyticus]